MKYKLYSHRYAGAILETDDEFTYLWEEIKEILVNITEENIISYFEREDAYGNRIFKNKSISRTINDLLKKEFMNKGWSSESDIFQDSYYVGDTWRLDFAKDNISIEVAFNHGSVIAWNLLKPVLASELNHVKKAIQTKIGIIICATEEMKRAGGFDNAIGTYEKFIDYLKPLSNQLTVPLLIIGLEKPETFWIKHKKVKGKNIGFVQYFY